MNKALLLLCLTLPASASPFRNHTPRRSMDRAPHTRSLGDHSKNKSSAFSGHVGHRTGPR